MDLKRQLASFAAIGVVSTIAYAVLYSALRAATAATVANASALALTTVGNTAANRWLTFGVRDRHSAVRHHLGGFVALAVALAVSTAAVLVLHRADPRASKGLELVVLVAANAVATVFRFVVLRSWIARDLGRTSVTVPVRRSLP